MSMALTFNEIQFDIIDRENRPWLRLYQIGSALDYEKPEVSISQLYARHSDEFTDSMTALVKLPSEGGEQETRIFSLRGCHLLAMFARTPVAKSFRKWVLDVLDQIAKEEDQQSGNTIATTITPEQQRTLQNIVDAKARQASGANNPVRRELYAQIWQRFKNHFMLARYQQLPQTKLAEAVTYLVQLEVQPKRQKAIEERTKHFLPSQLPADKYEAYVQEVESFRAETAAKIETLLHRGLGFVDTRRLGAGGVIAFTPILLDWLQRIAGQPNPLLRKNEPASRAIDYSPLYLLRHLEK